MRKKIVALGLTLVLSLGLVACGNDQAKDSSDGSKEDNVGVVEETSNSNDYSEELLAFKDFYSDFYSTHRDYTDDVGVYDCHGRIVINDGTMYMAIVDVLEEGTIFDLYLYEYNDKEVVEKTVLRDVKSRYIRISSINNELFVGGDGYAYKLDGDCFVMLNAEHESSEEMFNTGLGKDGMGASYLIGVGDELYGDFSNNEVVANIIMSVTPMDYEWMGTDFETMLDKIAESDIHNNTELEMFCSEYYYEKGYIDEDEVGVIYWQNGFYYMLYTDGTAKVLMSDYGYEDSAIAENVEGYKVDLEDWEEQNTSTLIAQDISTSEAIRNNVFCLTYDEETYRLFSDEFLIEINAGETSDTAIFTISGIENEEDKALLIEELNELINFNTEIQCKIDLDGSGVLQESYYVLCGNNGILKTYISSRGMTIEELKADRECDGIYQIYQETCDEYNVD